MLQGGSWEEKIVASKLNQPGLALDDSWIQIADTL